jgi:hypothetical protein
MTGQTVSHYRILERSGGWSIKRRDVKPDRFVPSRSRPMTVAKPESFNVSLSVASVRIAYDLELKWGHLPVLVEETPRVTLPSGTGPETLHLRCFRG